MNARIFAEEKTASYLERIDHKRTHSENVGDFLRDPIVELTRRILLYGEGGELGAGSGSAVGGGGGGGGSDDIGVNLLELETESYPSEGGEGGDGDGGDGTTAKSGTGSAAPEGEGVLVSIEDAATKPSLSRRSEARLEAFLLSCTLAVSDNPSPPRPSSQREEDEERRRPAEARLFPWACRELSGCPLPRPDPPLPR